MPAPRLALRGQPGATGRRGYCGGAARLLRLRGAGVEVKCEVGQRAGIADAVYLEGSYIVVKNNLQKMASNQSLQKPDLKTLANAFGWLLARNLLLKKQQMNI